MTSKILAFIVLTSCFLGFKGYSQSRLANKQVDKLWDMAIPFITSYSSEEYGGDSQNWDFVQADNGIIYVANSAGVLEYDGVKWRLIQNSKLGSVRSLAIDKKGVIYVGGSKEIGYLKPDIKGELHYQSLLAKLDPKFHDFTDVWFTYVLNGAVYFTSQSYIFKWHKNKFDALASSESFGRNTLIFKDRLIGLQDGEGLKMLDDNSLKLAPSGDKLLSKAFMIPLDKDRILVYRDSAFTYDFKEYAPLIGNWEKFFEGKKVYRGINLENRDLLLSTLGQGVFIVDGLGNTKSHFTKETGLISDVVYSSFVDRKGDVWLGTANGINKIEISNPTRKFDQYSGLGEGVFATAFHQNKIYAGCFDGLFSADIDYQNGFKNLAFKKVDNTDAIRGLFSLITLEDDLWVGDQEVYLFRDENQIQIKNPNVGSAVDYKIGKPFKYNHHLYTTDRKGHFYTLTKKGDSWSFGASIIEIPDRIHHLVEDNKGNVWLASYSDGIYKIEGLGKVKETSDTKAQVINLVKYDTLRGLPSQTENSVSLVGNKLYSGTKKGLFKYNTSSDIFERDTVLDLFFDSKEYSCGLISTGFDNNLWIPTFSEEEGEFQTKLFKISKNGMATEIVSLKRNKDTQVFNIYAEQRGIAMISGPKGIIFYNENKEKIESKNNLRLNIRKIRTLNDSIIFGGQDQPDHKLQELDYQGNNLRFEFALAEFHDSGRNQYRFQLVGNDKNWSSWTKETQKDYTNLFEGEYTFKVQGKNIYGKISEEDTYSFLILPPWYRTWWAYLFYILAGVMLLWFFMQWRGQQLRNKNLALEAVVDERTEEIRHKNKLLNHQTEKLKELDTMKTRLFANISHEFRTPLTLIKGPIEKLESKAENTISTPNIKMIRRNANRLLNLVNQLLDLSKLDSGKLKLNKAEGDVFKCIRAAASSFSSHAASRKMDYQIKISSRLLWAEFDRDKLEKIIYNLLSNAFKFTDDEEQVVIEAEFRSSRLHLKISDKGSGIASEKLPHIFDRFFQVDDSYTREKTGSGIGLALTKELTELMGGTIFVESELNRGTLFRVVVPMEEIKSGASNEIVDEAPISVFDDDLEYPETIASEAKEVKILIIEDNNDMRHFIREQLESDYEILEAINGKQGLKSAKKIVPDLIVTDLMMPQMDGITLCKKLKTDLATSHIPVIMLTAKAGIENKLEGLETGADEYLTKPFNARELQIRTKNLIEQRQNLRELFSQNISLDPKEITVTSLDEEFLNALLTLFEERHADSAFGVPQIQKELGMSKTALHAKVKALTNHPPGELLRNFRLKRAAQLLTQKGDNISQTAYDVGFNSLSYFTRCFKEYYGISPSDFIKKGDSKT